jgi:hypothetical protein
MSILLEMPDFSRLSSVNVVNTAEWSKLPSEMNVPATMNQLMDACSYRNQDHDINSGFINMSLFDDAGANYLDSFDDANARVIMSTALKSKTDYIFIGEASNDAAVTLFDFCLPDYFDMDDADATELEECQWIQRESEFKYYRNSQDDSEQFGGVFDFITNVNEAQNIPQSLVPVFEKAKVCGVSYILFNLGC